MMGVLQSQAPQEVPRVEIELELPDLIRRISRGEQHREDGQGCRAQHAPSQSPAHKRQRGSRAPTNASSTGAHTSSGTTPS